MLTKLALTLFSCLASIGCTFHSESKQSLELTDIEPNKNVQLPVHSWAKNQQQSVNSKLLPATNSDIESSQPWSTGLPSAKQGKPDERVSKKSEPKNYDFKAQLAVGVKTGSYSNPR